MDEFLVSWLSFGDGFDLIWFPANEVSLLDQDTTDDAAKIILVRIDFFSLDRTGFKQPDIFSTPALACTDQFDCLGIE